MRIGGSGVSSNLPFFDWQVPGEALMKYLGFSKVHATSDKIIESYLDYGQVDNIFFL